MMTRMIATIVVLALAVQSTVLAAVEKPNVIVILADDLRADCIGPVNPRIQTPNIDRLAKMGMRFNNCYLAGANGAGVCQPSRTMIMAGCSPFHLPVDHAALDAKPPAGCRTTVGCSGRFGKSRRIRDENLQNALTLRENYPAEPEDDQALFALRIRS